MQQHFTFSGDSSREWRLDEHTKEVGRRGVATARAILASCQLGNGHGDGQMPAAA